MDEIKKKDEGVVNAYDKMKKVELVALLLDADKSLETAKLALESARSEMKDLKDAGELLKGKIAGLEFKIKKLAKERDAFNAVADKTDKVIADLRKKHEGEIYCKQKEIDANKILLQDLQDKYDTMKALESNAVKKNEALKEDNKNLLEAYQVVDAKLAKMEKRNLWQRIINKKV